MAPSELTQDQLRQKFRDRAAESVRNAFDEFLRITTVRFWLVNSNDDPNNKHSVKFCHPPSGCGNCRNNPYSIIVPRQGPWLKFYVRQPARPSWDNHETALEHRFQVDFSPNPADEWTAKVRDVDAVRFLQTLSMTTDYPLGRAEPRASDSARFR